MKDKYKVLIKFKDKDTQLVYEKNDFYPKKGIEVSEERIKELSSKNNALNKPVIKDVTPKPKKKVSKNERKDS